MKRNKITMKPKSRHAPTRSASLSSSSVSFPPCPPWFFLFSLLILLSSCDLFTPPAAQAAPSAPTAPAPANRTMTFTVVEAANGEIADGFVTLEYAPPVNNSRALSLPLAKAATDFYEVVFHYDSGGADEHYRRNFREGQTIRMTVPQGQYNNLGDNKAYMFAGRYDSKTLLAVGKISKVEYKDSRPDDNGAPGTFLIDENTHRVTFELEALTTDVKADAASTFKTWGAGGYTAGQSVRGIKINGSVVPVFMIDKSADTAAAIDILTTHAAAIKPNTAAAQSTWFSSRGFFEPGMEAPMAAVTPSSPVFDRIAGVGIRIAVTLGAAGRDGLALLSYAVPVFNHSEGESPSTGARALTWYLTGGVTNAMYDLGTAADSQGGTIVLGSGDLSGFLTVDEDGFFIGGGYRPAQSTVYGVVLDKKAMELTSGATGALVATVLPLSAASRYVTWSSATSHGQRQRRCHRRKQARKRENHRYHGGRRLYRYLHRHHAL